MRAVSRAVLGGVGVAWGLGWVPPEARADTVETCVTAAEEGQKLQRAGRLRAARATFLSCDTATCPAEVRAVCDRLVNSVEADLPTVVFGARDAAGNDLVAVRVSVDGAALSESMDGKAVPLDPGPHTLRFEHEGALPVEESVVIREAETRRSIVVIFATVGVARPRAESHRDAAGPHEPTAVLAYVLGGVGVAALGSFVGLDVDGQSRYSACKTKSCSPATFDSLSVERGATLAVGGLGVVSLGVATWLLVARRSPPRATTALSFVSFDVPGPHGGGVLRAGGSF